MSRIHKVAHDKGGSAAFTYRGVHVFKDNKRNAEPYRTTNLIGAAILRAKTRSQMQNYIDTAIDTHGARP